MAGRFMTGLGIGGLLYAGLYVWPATQRGDQPAAVLLGLVAVFALLLLIGLRRSSR